MPLVAVRHAETAWNRRKLFMGALDVPLAPDALAVVPTVRADAVFCSPLRRATATSAAMFPSRAVTVDQRLSERDMGEWQGRAKAAVRAEHPDLFPGGHLDVRVTPPGGESLEDLLTRVWSALADLLPAARGREVVVVTHNGWIRAAQFLLGTARLEDFHASPAPQLRPVVLPVTLPIRLPIT